MMVLLLCTEPLSLPVAVFRDPLKWIVKIPQKKIKSGKSAAICLVFYRSCQVFSYIV